MPNCTLLFVLECLLLGAAQLAKPHPLCFPNHTPLFVLECFSTWFSLPGLLSSELRMYVVPFNKHYKQDVVCLLCSWYMYFHNDPFVCSGVF